MQVIKPTLCAMAVVSVTLRRPSCLKYKIMAKILLIDDSTDLLELFSMLLKKKGHKVKCVSSGDGLQDIISSFEPDLVLLDVLLKEENGRDLCKKIKEWSKTLPIILVSSDPSLLKGYDDCEADAVIEKPFYMQTVTTTVNKILNKAPILMH